MQLFGIILHAKWKLSIRNIVPLNIISVFDVVEENSFQLQLGLFHFLLQPFFFPFGQIKSFCRMNAVILDNAVWKWKHKNAQGCKQIRRWLKMLSSTIHRIVLKRKWKYFGNIVVNKRMKKWEEKKRALYKNWNDNRNFWASSRLPLQGEHASEYFEWTFFWLTECATRLNIFHWISAELSYNCKCSCETFRHSNYQAFGVRVCARAFQVVRQHFQCRQRRMHRQKNCLKV